MESCRQNGEDGSTLSLSVCRECIPPWTSFTILTERPMFFAQAEDYTFTLTGGDGVRTLGFCRRSLPPGSGERYPQARLAISSSRPRPLRGSEAPDTRSAAAALLSCGVSGSWKRRSCFS